MAGSGQADRLREFAVAQRRERSNEIGADYAPARQFGGARALQTCPAVPEGADRQAPPRSRSRCGRRSPGTPRPIAGRGGSLRWQPGSARGSTARCSGLPAISSNGAPCARTVSSLPWATTAVTCGPASAPRRGGPLWAWSTRTKTPDGFRRALSDTLCCGSPTWIRTRNLLINSQPLYR